MSVVARRASSVALGFVLACLLSFLLVATVSQPAFADDVTTYNIRIADISVTSANAADVLGDGKVSYDPTTKTLTLTDVNIDTKFDGRNITNGISIGESDVTLVLNGANVFTTQQDVFQVCKKGSCTITGTGSLTCFTPNSDSNGIAVMGSLGQDATLTLAPSFEGTVSATGSTGIICGGKLNVLGGTLKGDCNGKRASGNAGGSFYLKLGGTLEIFDGTVFSNTTLSLGSGILSVYGGKLETGLNAGILGSELLFPSVIELGDMVSITNPERGRICTVTGISGGIRKAERISVAAAGVAVLDYHFFNAAHHVVIEYVGNATTDTAANG